MPFMALGRGRERKEKRWWSRGVGMVREAR
jgi:hypothetical protein